MNDYKIIALRALRDNYIWVIYNKQDAIIIDPTLANVVEIFLKEYQLNPVACLLTHAHEDHIGGVNELKAHHPQLVIYDNFNAQLRDDSIISINGFAPVEASK